MWMAMTRRRQLQSHPLAAMNLGTAVQALMKRTRVARAANTMRCARTVGVWVSYPPPHPYWGQICHYVPLSRCTCHVHSVG